MSAGEEPKCLLDFWMINTIEEIAEAKENNSSSPPHRFLFINFLLFLHEIQTVSLFSSDEDIGNTLLDFLFAAQDASTASLVWVLSLLAVSISVS